MAIDRTPRSSETREKQTRQRPWAPPGAFPMDLNSDPDVRYRWVRTHYNGAEVDNGNLYKRMQAGWRPVTADEMPELEMFKDPATGRIVNGGTVLCKNSAENVQRISDYYSNQANGQLEGATSEFENGHRDSRMPKFSEGNVRTRIIRNS